MKPESRREILAGATAFVTICYIVIVNPVILQAAGVPFGPAMVATIVTAGVATILCGLYAKKPFVLAPYMGENAFFAYAVVIGLGVAWTAALGAVLIAGLIFLVLAFSPLRRSLVEAVPPFLSATWGAAIGLFLIFIGLANAGISVPGVPGAPIDIGKLAEPEAVVVFVGLAITFYLHLKKVTGSLLIGTAVTLVLGTIIGLLGLGVSLPHSIPPLFGPLPDWGAVLFQMDIMGALNLTMLPVIIVLFLMIFLDTAGTALGLGAKAGALDEKGRMEGLDRIMQVDAAATTMAGVFGTGTTGVFIESASGIEEGGRTGRTAIVAGVLLLAMLPFTAFFSGLPPGFLSLIIAPALVVVGVGMMFTLKKIDFEDAAQAIPAVMTIAFVLFTFNIGFGLAIGLIAYPLIMVAMARRSELKWVSWLLFAMGLLLFLIYPY